MTRPKRPWPPDAEVRDLTLSMLDGFVDRKTREIFRNEDLSWEQFKQRRFAAECEAARRGDPKLLRRAFPQIAEFIFAPPLRRGQRYAKPKPFPADYIRGQLREVRAFWQAEYGRGNRRGYEVDGALAVKIVAEYLGITEHAVRAAMHPSGPSGKRKTRKVRAR